MSNEVKIKIKAKNEATGEFKKAESEAKKTADKISSDFKKMNTNILAGVKSVARFGASLASLASLAGPAMSGILAIGHGIAAMGSALVSMAPAAAVLPGLAASVGFVALAVKAAAPGIQAGLKPISDSFAGVSAKVAELAGKGLPELARQFVKVNMPTIATNMGRIAESLNGIVTNTMSWVNSAAGQQAIATITTTTATAFAKLAPHIDRVVQSLGNMIARVGGGAIGGLADMLGRAADATARWMDSIDATKVRSATDAIKGFGGHIKDTFTMLKDTGEWMASHVGTVKAFSDALAVAGIALGAATGNIPAILAGVFSLTVNHWAAIKGVLSGGASWISGIWKAIAADPNAQEIWTNVKAAVKGMVDSFKKYLPEIKDAWNTFTRDLKNAWDQWGPAISEWWKTIGAPAFRMIGAGLANLIIGLLQVSSGAASFANFVGERFRWLVAFVLSVLGTIVNAAAIAFGWIPGIGPKLTNAANEFSAFRNRVNNELAGIHDKTVTVRLNYFENRVIVGAAGGMGMKASGGIVGVSRAAAGGPRNNMTLVGEHGPELVNLRPGTMVTPAGKTRSMLNAASGGGAPEPIVLVVSGGTQMDDILCDILRRAIGRRGGNVQNVLGDAA